MIQLFRKLNLTVFLILIFLSSFSQLKYEKESRLKRAGVPIPALELIESLAIPGKIKWYSEESLTGSTVEAKFRLNKKHYSVEFDTEGNLQDVEITIEFAEIHADAKENIFKKLESEFNKFSIQKIQAQYSGKNPDILSIIKNPQNKTGIDLKYELIVNGKTGNTAKQYEMVFDNNGILTEKKEIIQKNADNLEF
jgi:hypothetical protein